MDEREKRRQFQKVKSFSTATFWNWMNDTHTRAYAKAIGHMREAMSCNQRISKSMIDEVLTKAEEIREKWDGMTVITVDDTEAVQFKTATEMIHNLTPTEAVIFNLEEESVITIKDRKFVVRPYVEEAENDGDTHT